MPSTSNFDLTYNQQNVVAGGALSNPAATTGVTGGGVDQIIAGSNITISPTGGTGNVTISATAGGTGTVTSVATGTGLTGGPITTSGTISLASAYAGNGIGTVNGIAKGNGSGTITAATAGTDYVIPSGSITGTAGNITATSNSTLTTLSALSLPGSQVSGNISGNAANITATSNSTLTTLSALSLPGSQVSGNISGNSANVTGTVAIGNGGTGATTASAARTNLGLGSVATQTAPSGTSSQLLANNGTGGFNNVTVGSGLSYSGGTLSSSAGGGTVTSVGTAGSVNGITLTGGPITTSGTITLGGTLGSIANSQLSNSSVTVTAGTGLSGGGSVSLGGSTTLTNAGVTSLTAGTGISLSGSTGGVTITNTVSGLPSGSQGQALLYGTSGAAFLSTAINVNTYSSVSAAISAAQSAGAALYIPQGTYSYSVSSNTTITCPIYIDGQLNITVSGGVLGTPVTLLFNGTVVAPLKKVLSISLSNAYCFFNIGVNTPYIYPEWFGTAKSGSSDDQPGLASALASVGSAPSSSAPNQSIVLTGTYYLGSSLTVSNSQVFKVVGGASFYPYGSYTGDCIIYQYNTNNTLTDIPTIQNFTTGAGITILGCSVMKATGFMIKKCKYGIKVKAVSGHPVLDNYVNVHFLPDCQYGVFFTDDGTSATIQGNEIYSNFYTNDNLSTPWSSPTSNPDFPTGYQSSNIAACYWDNLNVYNWNGNTVQIKAIDINGATNSYGFYNASNFSTYGGYAFLNGWQLGCPLWFGGINSDNLSSAYYMSGYFLDSEFRYAIQTPSSSAPYNLINIQGSGNRFIFARGGGSWNYNTTNGLPQTYYQAQDTANSRSSFATSSVAYCAPFTNRIYCTYTISSTIAPGAELTLYVYTPVTDAYIQSSIFGASNNFTVQPLANYGLLPEVVYDNSLTNANEVVVKFRNVSGSNISSGTFNFMVTVGL
jgi:hypothetical protein